MFSLHQLKKMILYKACPCCGKSTIHAALSAIDYTVSKKQFEIWQCDNCHIRFTQNAPGKEEIGQYYQSSAYISHSDTAQGFINKMYHKVRRHTLLQKKKLIINITGKKKGAILDIGAGTGAFINVMKEAGWKITGLEPDLTARTKAKELYDVALNNPEHLFSLTGKSFDAITMWHVLEHVHELHEYLDKLKNLLKPDGKLIIAVPNYTCYDEKFYKQYWAAYDVPRHLYHFSPQSFYTLMTLHEMKVVALRPMWYDSFYVSMLSEKYKTGSANILRAVFIGAISNLKVFFTKEKCSSVIYIIESVPQ